MVQRHNECLLASVCAVTGNDYATASDLFAALHGVGWYQKSKQDGNADSWYSFLAYIAPNFGPRVPQWIELTESMDLSGTGIIVIVKGPALAHTHAHALAFADGVVYDSAYDAYGTLDETMARYSDWRVLSVTR